jgi:hypothetical protein
MKSQLVAGLEGMLQQRHRFDYILIETSGAKCFDVAMVSCALLIITNACPCSDVDKRTMKHCQVCAGLANPGPVATALWTDTELEAGVTLDGIVTVSFRTTCHTSSRKSPQTAHRRASRVLSLYMMLTCTCTFRLLMRATCPASWLPPQPQLTTRTAAAPPTRPSSR